MGTRTPARHGAADILTIGFGTTVAMWTIGYACRLFGDAVPATVVFGLLLACMLGGGIVAGRFTRRGTRGGAYAGLLAGALNLLVVGSLISRATANDVKRGAVLWIPGTLAASVLLGAAGAALGSLGRGVRRDPAAWRGGLAAVAVGATLVLLTAGGLVTGSDEGLAVVDWPNSEGYNMFLYPLARMTGGVYLEHSHRLLGSLVGLTTLVLAIQTHATDNRLGVKALAWFALAAVIFQGILGGLRVTGHFTLSTRPADTSPSVLLAIVHGVFGQLVFGGLVALAVCRSAAWSAVGQRVPAATVSTDRVFGIALIVLLIMQLVLGALVRHFTWALDVLRYGLATDPTRLVAIGQHVLIVHITMAVVVVLLALAVGVRAWGLYERVPAVQRLGSTLLVLVALQLGLGIAALVAVGDDSVARRPRAIDVAITTAHQVVGAALLAVAVMLVLWNYRSLTMVQSADGRDSATLTA